MDLRHLETFVRISELKSFTRAAEELYLTQPTVSKQIVDLERYFDIRLIDRTKRSVELTRAGELLLRYAKDFIYLKREVIEAMANFKGLKKGAIHIGASNIPGIYILPGVLNSFRERFPEIVIRMTISDSKDIMVRVEQGELDIGFVGAKDDARKLEYKKFLDDTIIMVAPGAFPDSIDMKDLGNYPLIARETGSGTRKAFDTALRKLNAEAAAGLRVTVELTDTEAIKELLKNGMGMAYISRMAVHEELTKGILKILRIPGFSGIKRSFFIVTKKGKTVLPQAKALVDTIESLKKNLLAGTS